LDRLERYTQAVLHSVLLTSSSAALFEVLSMKLAASIRLALRIVPVLAVALGVTSILFARGAPSASTAPTAEDVKYIGATKCKSCHSSDDAGNQYAKWSGMNHAKAWETLGTDKAKELAKAKGIADPQQSEACLKCHVTGYGLSPDHFKGKWDPKLGVQCESCHGPGDAHMKARMADAAKRDPSAPGRVQGRARGRDLRRGHRSALPQVPQRGEPDLQELLLPHVHGQDPPPQSAEEARGRGEDGLHRSVPLRGRMHAQVPDEVSRARALQQQRSELSGVPPRSISRAR
jgi:hypothetical protein